MVKDYRYEYDIEKILRARRQLSQIKRRPRRAGPNGLERKLQQVLGSAFVFTGDGSFKIDNLRPDFINKTRKLVVEVYGDYWHKNEPLYKTMQRISRFERCGWRVIIIWEHEINDPVKLSRKLMLI